MTREAVKERQMQAARCASLYSLKELTEQRLAAKLMGDKEEHRIFELACKIKSVVTPHPQVLLDNLIDAAKGALVAIEYIESTNTTTTPTGDALRSALAAYKMWLPPIAPLRAPLGVIQGTH